MNILESALNKAMRDIINLILDTPDFAIVAQQPDKSMQESAPRPSGSYASVHIVSMQKVGQEELYQQNQPDPDLDINSQRRGWREIFYSLNFYRSDSFDNAATVQIGLMREAVQELLIEANLGLGTRSDVRDISEALDSGWEDRAQLDVVLFTVAADDDVIRSIDEVTITGEYQPFKKGTPIQTEVTIP